MKCKTVELVEIGPDFCLDTLYSNVKYDEPFIIEDKYGEVHKVNLAWEQGRGQNYRFVRGEVFGYNDGDIVWPCDVTYIEVR
ncbi:hypothetical protein fHeYen901_255 [Yersinia phage fHe-Yen9-01]|uniref:Phage protein n=1 Tax=Yersinia phage fHe-Yen9-01 TaxID=1965363 RepID=A0A1V0DY11_9CAUD|nr:hypothetical protein KNT60_gp254 [Yersinia phage fHe-Yen9-01]ARB06028.1 hypothetical protein fHeYen901_255 [Yersinia phage fHe-Yen9-01]